MNLLSKKYIKLAKQWDSLHSSFWFVPTVMVVLAIALSFITISIDQKLETDFIAKLNWAYALGPNGSRGIDLLYSSFSIINSS